MAKKSSNKRKKNKKSDINKNGKVQVWVKKETLAYEAELHRLQVELLKFQKPC